MSVKASDRSSETNDDSIAAGNDEPSDISNCNANSVVDDCFNPSQEAEFPQEKVSSLHSTIKIFPLPFDFIESILDKKTKQKKKNIHWMYTG